MRRILQLVLAALLTWPAGLAAQVGPSVDPVLRLLAEPDERTRIEAAVAAMGPVAPLPARAPGIPGRPGAAHRDDGGIESLVALDRDGPAGETRVGVLVHLAGSAGLDALRAAGAEIGAVVGDVASARVPLAALPELLRAPALLRVEAARRLTIEHDESMTLIGAAGLRTWDGERWRGLTGEGVIVGVYDTGLDLSHRDFQHADGSTRVIGLWDQSRTGPPPPATQLTGELAYGHYCSPSDIDDGACPQRDIDGHGTHVTGTAAGGGLALGPDASVNYSGAAPGADLLIVNGLTAQGLRSDFLLDGIAWLVGRARDLGQPIALNLSLGVAAGPRDGTGLLELAVDQLSGPGNVIVTSAGNNGSNHGQNRDLTHGMWRTELGTGTFTFRVPSYTRSANPCNDFALIEIWHPGEDALTIRVRRPDGSELAVSRGEALLQNAPGGRIIVWNDEGPHPLNGDIEAAILVDGCNTTQALTGEWTIEFEPETAQQSGRPFHLWIVLSAFGNQRLNARGQDGFDNRYVISSPSPAHHVLAVGGYVVRQCWTSIAGQFCGAVRPEEIGDLVFFSAAGPTRDERIRPDIVAPGAWIASALSTAAGIDPPLIVPGGRHWVLRGTSMAAPHVTGSAALLYQWDPSLTPADLRQTLRGTAIQDQFTQRTYEVAPPSPARPDPRPEHWWGAGKLDARSALVALGALSDPARLIVQAEPLSPPEAPVGRREARVPLLLLTARVEGDEPIRLVRLAATVTGPDPEARVVLLHDRAGDGTPDPDDPVVASAPMPPNAATRVELRPDFVVPPGDPTHFILAVEVTGVAPEGATYRATYLPQFTRTVGVETLAVNQLEVPAQPVVGEPVRTRILVDEAFSLSENPIRSDRVIFNFREPPRRAAIYTPDGRLVIDLLAAAEPDVRMVWELTNHRDQPVVAGIYLAIFELSDVVIRERLLVVRPGQGSQGGSQ